MSWKTIDDPALLDVLLTGAEVTCMRVVVLGKRIRPDVFTGPTGPDDLQSGRFARRAIESPGTDRVYELFGMDTDPALVVVADVASGSVIAAYVWASAGGKLQGGRDGRLVELGHALEAEYHGQLQDVAGGVA